MIQFNIFPGGKKKVVTFSYDDGHKNDIKLAELLRKYGVKATFHLNEYLNDFIGRKDTLAKVYEGHEIACHTSRHGWLNNMAKTSIISETLDNRRALEEVAGYPVVGMSYPWGALSPEVKDILRSCGIVYSRTTVPAPNFSFPNDFLEWNPTCHQGTAPMQIEKFMSDLDAERIGPLLYIWGHAHEFTCEEHWVNIENIIKSVANNDKIWYATNIEIYNYKMAQRALRISVDENTFYNPTDIDVWVEKNRNEKIFVPAGKTVVSGQ